MMLNFIQNYVGAFYCIILKQKMHITYVFLVIVFPKHQIKKYMVTSR